MPARKFTDAKNHAANRPCLDMPQGKPTKVAQDPEQARKCWEITEAAIAKARVTRDSLKGGVTGKDAKIQDRDIS